MANIFTDTNKYKKPFIRSLKGPYKVLWDYLYHDCDHAGIWIVDFDIAQIYIGSDLPVNKDEALKLFNSDEVRIIEFDNSTKWFIKSFIEFQYGILNEKNRVHNSIIQILSKYNLLNYKPLISPLQGVKDMDKDKDKDMDKDKEENQETEIVIDKSQEKTIKFLCKEFGFSEQNHFQNYKIIVTCVSYQYSKGEEIFKHFKNQVWNYFSYKNLSKDKKHSFNGFIGSSEESYSDGGWNAENWIKKYLELQGEEENPTVYPKEKSKKKIDRDWNKKRDTKEIDFTKISDLKKNK